MNIRTLVWIAESQENETKQTEERNVSCHRQLWVPDSTTSNSVFASHSRVIYNLENVSPTLSLHVRMRGQEEILFLWGWWGS